MNLFFAFKYLSKYQTMIKIVDYASSFDQDLWNNCQDYIENSKDKLKNNYINLNPRNYASFPVVTIDDKIVCFSALEINEERWGKGIGRCSTRMWIHPDYRHSGKFSGGDKFLNTTYCLPFQLAMAKIKKLDCVFISREYNLRGFTEYLKLIKINTNTDFAMESTRYNVCGSLYPVPESCKQWVMTHYLTDKGESVWKSNMKSFMLIE
jgi:hypothetical protein